MIKCDPSWQVWHINALFKGHDYCTGVLGTCQYKGPHSTLFHAEQDAYEALNYMALTWYEARPHAIIPSGVNQDSSIKPTLLHSARCHRRRAFAHSSWLRRQTAGRSRPRRGRQARRWAVLWWSLWFRSQLLRQLASSLRWRSRMWKSWTGVVTHGYANGMLPEDF